MTRKLVVEAIGTFFLVLTMGLVVLNPGTGFLGPLSVAGILVAMIYAGGHISGAHYNPAVSLGVLLRGRMTAVEMLAYWAAQFGGGLLAAFTARRLLLDAEPVSFPVELMPALLAEFLFTFIYVFVWMNVGLAKGTRGNTYFGAAIGLVVLASGYAIGGISYAALNPSVAASLMSMRLIPGGSMWILMVGELLGGLAAALVFGLLNLGEAGPTDAAIPEEALLEAEGEPGV